MSATVQIPACIGAICRNGEIIISYADGIEVRFKASTNRRLRTHSDASLNDIIVGHFGISWPELDEDLSHAGLRSGRYGQE